MGEFAKEGVGFSTSLIVVLLIAIILIALWLSGGLMSIILFIKQLIGALVAYLYVSLLGIFR